jgi:hypothetical protein
VSPRRGADNVTVDDLTGTAATQVDMHAQTADLRVDTLKVAGGSGPETLRATTSGTTHAVSGLGATVRLVDPERGEKLVIDGRGGDDTVDASGVEREKIQPFLNGGAGKDLVVGSSGQDVLSGGAGVDVAFMGGGLDTFNWAPGDGNDIVEGGAGTDFLNMTGSAANERFEISAVGTRTRLRRDVENVDVDLGDVERYSIFPGTGADTMRVNDLSGSDTTNVDFLLSLATTSIAPDKTADSVLVEGTAGDDAVTANGAGPQVRVSGLPTIVTTRGSDPALDKLHVDTRSGNDSVTVTGSTHQLIGFTSS